MAVPPSALRPPVVPDPAVAHTATVKELERCLDAALLGKRSPPGEPVELLLPVGVRTEDVLAEVAAHYVAAGWGSATYGTSGPGPSGHATLTLTPPGYVTHELRPLPST